MQSTNHVNQTPSKSPASPSVGAALNLLAELHIGDNQHLYHVDVSPYNDVISVKTAALQITKLSYMNKEYKLKFKKDIPPSLGNCREATFLIGTDQNIIARSGNQTNIMSSEFEPVNVYRGHYGTLLCSSAGMHQFYAAPLLRTGRYKLNHVTRNHQHVTEICQLSSVPKLACYPPHCAVLDTKTKKLTLIEISKGRSKEKRKERKKKMKKRRMRRKR